MKILGKPYAGKLHVRFDEGAGRMKTFHLAALLYRETKKKAASNDDLLKYN